MNTPPGLGIIILNCVILKNNITERYIRLNNYNTNYKMKESRKFAGLFHFIININAINIIMTLKMQ